MVVISLLLGEVNLYENIDIPEISLENAKEKNLIFKTSHVKNVTILRQQAKMSNESCHLGGIVPSGYMPRRKKSSFRTSARGVVKMQRVRIFQQALTLSQHDHKKEDGRFPRDYPRELIIWGAFTSKSMLSLGEVGQAGPSPQFWSYMRAQRRSLPALPGRLCPSPSL